MAFMITPECTGKETICKDICAYNCIKTLDVDVAERAPRFKIDEEQCTDCCACALACPESAIVHDDAFAGFHGPKYGVTTHATPTPPRAGEWDMCDPAGEHDSTASIELPDGYLKLNGEIESWARLMAASSD